MCVIYLLLFKSGIKHLIHYYTHSIITVQERLLALQLYRLINIMRIKKTVTVDSDG